MKVQFDWTERTPPDSDAEAQTYTFVLQQITRRGRGKRSALIREGNEWLREQYSLDEEFTFDELSEEARIDANALYERATLLCCLVGVTSDGEPAEWDTSIEAMLEMPSELWDTWLVAALQVNPHLGAMPNDEDAKKNGGASAVSYLTQ